MSRQSISFTKPNARWLRTKVDVEGEYASNSEAVNNLIRKARNREAELDLIRAKLIASEQSGFIDEGRDEILAAFKDDARCDGKR